MAHEVEVKVSSARDLKNVNWRHGPNRPYAVVWVDPSNKCSTRIDQDGDTWANWEETLVIPVPAGPIEGFTLYIDVVHGGPEEDTKKLIGSARLRLSDVVNDVGFGERATRSLPLKRPSGRPQGKVDIKVTVREPRYRAPDPYYASPYGVPPPKSSRDYEAPYGAAPYGGPAAYGGAAATRDPYYSAAPPSGYPYSASSQPQPYGQQGYGYGQGPPAYGQSQGSYGSVPEDKKKSKFGMGTGLAVGAVAGVLGGLALAEGAEYVENKIADDAAEKVEDDDDLGYDDDDGDY